MIDMRHSAQRLAARGRFGDTMLLHVNPMEVAGIASLVPGGRLTINPETGLPEAFFFLPFLASLFGAAAPAAAAATAGAAAATTALGAGAATAAGGALASTLGAGALTPALTAGTSLAAGAGSLGAAAAPALAAAAPVASGIGGLASTLGAGALTPTLTAGTSLAAPAAAAAPAAGLVGHAGISSLLGAGGADALGVDAITTGSTAAAAPVATVAPFGIGAKTAGVSSLASPETLPEIGGIPASANLPVTPTPLAPHYVPTSLPGATGTPVHAAIHAPPVITKPSSAIVVTGAGGGAPGGTGTGVPAVTSPAATTATETTSKTGLSGLSKYLDMKYLMPAYLGLQMIKGLIPAKKSKHGDDEDAKRGAALPYQGGDPVFPPSGYDAGSASGEWNYFPQPIKYFANGGIVSLANGGPVDPQQQLPQDMSFPLNGGGIGALAGTPSMEELPTSDYPTSQVGSTPEPAPADEVAAPTDGDKELIMQTVEAIKGKSADPQPILLAFIKEFGEQAFQDLVTRIRSSGQNQQQAQQGDGQSDSIPATIDGRQPARLSQDEFVIPADVVSGLGNGSTSAGAKHLTNMVGNVRQAKTGRPSQPKPVNAGSMIPGYKKGGKVKAPSAVIGESYIPTFEDIGNYDSWTEIGTNPRSSRLGTIYRDFNMPVPVPSAWGPEAGEEWASKIRAYQDAKRFNYLRGQGMSVEEALNKPRPALMPTTTSR